MPKQPQPAPLDGALVIDKPRGQTSHDVVAAVRRLLGFRQIGHLGTLDPLATGVLVLLLGRATRLAQFYSGRRKRYSATFRFGFSTDSYDADGAPLGPDAAPTLDRPRIEELAAARVGRFEQIPPPFSAKKIQGRHAYDLARSHQPVQLAPVEIEVYEFRVVEVQGSMAKFVIECTAGSYIRSLANEMGSALGCGAHLAEITRLAVGEFTLDHAVRLEELVAATAERGFARYVVPLERLLPELPSVVVPPAVEKRVRHGAKFDVQISQIQPGRLQVAQGATAEFDSGEWKPARARIFNHEQQLIAIAQAVVPRTYQPVVVLSPQP